jgi:hypothetical protein
MVERTSGDEKNQNNQRVISALIVVFVICILFGSGCVCFDKYFKSEESSIRWVNPSNWNLRRRSSKRQMTTMSEHSDHCIKCRVDSPNNTCGDCDACDNCKIEDKCGSCQKFERQTSLRENQKPCVLCNKKPCKCRTMTGKRAVTEPGVSRDGIYSSGMSNMVYI